MGFDAKILRKVISIRKQDADERAEQEAILDTYLHALGMIDQPSFFDDEPRQTTPVDRKARAALRTSEAMDDNKAFSAELVAAGLISEEAHAENIALSDAVAMKLGAGVIDPATGEILDDAPVTIIDRTDEDGHRLAVTVDPEIAAILACRREQERSDGGLNIITKHTEIATSAGGESEEVAKNAVASASGPDEKRAPNLPATADEMDRATESSLETGSEAAENARKAVPETEDGSVSHAGAGESPAATSTAKPKYVLRPHCLNPGEACGGYSDKHCHACTVAMRKREQAEEVA